MVPTTEQRPLTRGYAPVPDETSITGLVVEGDLPTALTGRYLRTGPNPIAGAGRLSDSPDGDAMVHAITLRAGRAVSYRNRWVLTDATSVRLGLAGVPGPRPGGVDHAGTNVVAFGHRILAMADGAVPYELTADLDTVRRVDLAGGARGVGAFPKVDPLTGELHLLSFGREPACVVHAISPGGLTRTSRTIDDAPGRVRDLVLTRDHLVLVGDGFVGLTRRGGDERITWTAASTACCFQPFSAYDEGPTAVVHVTGHALERWALDRSAGTCRRTVVDPDPHAFGCVNVRLLGAPHRYVYAIPHHGDGPLAGTVVTKHDLRTGGRQQHDFGPGRHPGELVYVPDPGRAGLEDGGWLVGFVHGCPGGDTTFVVLDAEHLERPPVAAVHIPRRIPFGLHGAWIPGLT